LRFVGQPFAAGSRGGDPRAKATPGRCVYDGYTEPARRGCAKRSARSATAISRPAVPRRTASADDVHYPGTYLAGGYNRLTSEIAGRKVENEDLVNLPNWLPLTFRIDDGAWFRLDEVELLSFRQELDLRHGVLRRDLRFRDAKGRTTRWNERRLVSMADPHLAALSVELTAEDWSGRLTVRSALDGGVTNRGVARYRGLADRHLDISIWNIGAPTRCSCAAAPISPGSRSCRRPARAVSQRRRVETERAHAGAGEADRTGIPAPCEEQTPSWSRRSSRCTRRATGRSPSPAWRRCGRSGRPAASTRCSRARACLEAPVGECDIGLEDHAAPDTELKLRVHMFHLLQTASEHTIDLDTGIPARGWHGEAYRGHIFWDELFIFPFLSLRIPMLTRALLRYRHRRLPEARRAAQEAGSGARCIPGRAAATAGRKPSGCT
jgi:alpha,alpha-trehalase